MGPWETFEVIALGDGNVALWSTADGRYVCAEDAGQSPLIANRPAVGPWETFAWVPLGGDSFALRSGIRCMKHVFRRRSAERTLRV